MDFDAVAVGFTDTFSSTSLPRMTILSSHDGIVWTQLNASSSSNLSIPGQGGRTAFNSSNLLQAGKLFTVAKFENVIIAAGERDIRAITNCSSSSLPRNGYGLKGLTPVVLQSTDNGTNFRSIYLSLTSDAALYGSCLSDGSNGFVVGFAYTTPTGIGPFERIYETTDSGNTWSPHSLSPTYNHNNFASRNAYSAYSSFDVDLPFGVACAEANRVVFIVGSHNGFQAIWSSRRGSSGLPRSLPQVFDEGTLYDVTIASPSVAYACGSRPSVSSISGVVLRTTDGGRSWVPTGGRSGRNFQSFPFETSHSTFWDGPNSRWNDFEDHNSERDFFGHESDMFGRERDREPGFIAGSGLPGRLLGIVAASELEVYVSGVGVDKFSVLLRTIDGGRTWNLHRPPLGQDYFFGVAVNSQRNFSYFNDNNENNHENVPDVDNSTSPQRFNRRIPSRFPHSARYNEMNISRFNETNMTVAYFERTICAVGTTGTASDGRGQELIYTAIVNFTIPLPCRYNDAGCLDTFPPTYFERMYQDRVDEPEATDSWGGGHQSVRRRVTETGQCDVLDHLRVPEPAPLLPTDFHTDSTREDNWVGISAVCM